MPVAAHPKLTEVGGHRAESRPARRQRPTTASARGRTPGPNSPAWSPTPPHAASPSCRRSRCRATSAPPSPPIPHLGNRPGRAAWRSGRAGGCATPSSGSTTRSSTSAAPSSTRSWTSSPSPYVHLGGEECPTTEWTHSRPPRAPGRPRRGWRPRRPARLVHGPDRRLPRRARPPPARLGRDRGRLPRHLHRDDLARPAHTACGAARRGHARDHGAVPPLHLPRLPPVRRPGEPPGQPGSVVDLRDRLRPRPRARRREPEAAAGCSAPRPSCGPSTSPPPRTPSTSPSPGCAPSPTAPGAARPTGPDFQARLHRPQRPARRARRAATDPPCTTRPVPRITPTSETARPPMRTREERDRAPPRAPAVAAAMGAAALDRPAGAPPARPPTG